MRRQSLGIWSGPSLSGREMLCLMQYDVSRNRLVEYLYAADHSSPNTSSFCREEIRTWVVLQCRLAVCRLDLICSCSFGNAEDSIRFDRGRFVINEILILMRRHC